VGGTEGREEWRIERGRSIEEAGNGGNYQPQLRLWKLAATTKVYAISVITSTQQCNRHLLLGDCQLRLQHCNT